jgi:biopolymer transport protein ExbD
MADIIESGGNKKGGKKGRKKAHPGHVDMTPMVDLACLLLTFFMLTTAFSKAKVMEIVLPDKLTDKQKEKVKQPEVDKDKVINIILIDDKVYYYNGLADPKKGLPELQLTNFSKDGIRKILLKRNKDLYLKLSDFNKSIATGKLKIPKDSIEKSLRKIKKEDQVGPVVLIKAGDKVKYGSIVDIIDEMAICSIARYAIVDLTPPEKLMVAKVQGTAPVASNQGKN